jgi:flagellar biosynthesis component FlhA
MDHMPRQMKKMEDDYGAGRITEDEKSKRKQILQNETDFCSALYGAAQFITGSLKIGVFIIVLATGGGLIAGKFVMNKEGTVMEILRPYAASVLGAGLLFYFQHFMVSLAVHIHFQCFLISLILDVYKTE